MHSTNNNLNVKITDITWTEVDIMSFYCWSEMTSYSHALQVIFYCGFWKCDPDFVFMFHWHLWSILNGLYVIQLFGLAGISLLGAKLLGLWGQNDPKNVKIGKNTWWEGTTLRQTACREKKRRKKEFQTPNSHVITAGTYFVCCPLPHL